MLRMWHMLLIPVVAFVWFAGSFPSLATAQTATSAGDGQATPSALPWLGHTKPKPRRSGPPLPTRKPARTASTPAPEAAKARPVPVNAELIHAAVPQEPQPAETASAAEAPVAAPTPEQAAREEETPEAETEEKTPAPEPTATVSRQEEAVDAPPPARKPLPASETRPVATPASGKPAPAPERKPAQNEAAAAPAPARPAANTRSVSQPAPDPKPPASEQPERRKAVASLAPLPSRKPEKPAPRAPEPRSDVTDSAAPQDRDGTAEPRQTAQNKTKKQQCLALRACRVTYTRCFNRLEKEVKPELWSSERTKCVNTYKACINKHFKSGEMFFTRWFTPYETCE